MFNKSITFLLVFAIVALVLLGLFASAASVVAQWLAAVILVLLLVNFIAHYRTKKKSSLN